MTSNIDRSGAPGAARKYCSFAFAAIALQRGLSKAKEKKITLGALVCGAIKSYSSAAKTKSLHRAGQNPTIFKIDSDLVEIILTYLSYFEY